MHIFNKLEQDAFYGFRPLKKFLETAQIPWQIEKQEFTNSLDRTTVI